MSEGRRADAAATTAIDFGSGAIGRPGGERFLFGFAAPLAGAALIVSAGVALAVRQPEARLAVGLVAAFGSCVALAVLAARGLLARRAYGLHVGAATTAFAVALLCAGPMLAAAGIFLSALALGWGVVRGAVHEAAVLVPAVTIPLVAAVLHPGIDFALIGLLVLASASALLALRRRGAALILLAAPLVFLLHAVPYGAGAGLWLAVAGAGLGFVFQWVASPVLRTTIARFVMEMIALAYVMDAVFRASGNRLTAALAAAAVSLVSAVAHSLAVRQLSIERFICMAIFLIIAAMQDNRDNLMPTATVVLGLAAALQLAAVAVQSLFTSRAALVLCLIGAAVPLTGVLNGKLSTIGLATGLLAAAVMALFSRRVDWVREPPWWRDLIALRSAAHVRAWMRSGGAALRDVPVVGPVIRLGQRAWELLTGFVRREHALGLPEAAMVGALLYAVLITTTFVESNAMWAGLSPATERMIVAAIWCAVGLAAYAAGSVRPRAYLRLTGVIFVVAILVRAYLQRDGTGIEVVTLIAGAALMLIGAASLGRGSAR